MTAIKRRLSIFLLGLLLFAPAAAPSVDLVDESPTTQLVHGGSGNAHTGT